MTKMRLESFVLLIVLGFFCVANSNPITSLFGKSSDDKVESDDKLAINAASAAKVGETATTTTLEPSSSCGGLKGFLHICEKNNPTEPPKSVKRRSAADDDSDEDEDDSSSDEDSDESEEKPMENEKVTETSPNVSEATEGKISKRQVGDPGAPILGEVPPVLSDAMEAPEEPAEDEKPEEDGDVEKRQVDDSDSDSDSDEDESQERRQRRDCRESDEDDEKDCRKKREYVPSCSGKNCRSN